MSKTLKNTGLTELITLIKSTVEDLFIKKTNIEQTPSTATDKIVSSNGLKTYVDSLRGVYFATCDSNASEVNKVATLTNSDGFELKKGITVIVNFTNNNTASKPTLNVNNTSALPMYQYGTTAMSTANETSGWLAGACVMLIYDGNGWVRDQGFNTNTTYYYTGVACTTSASTAAKAGTSNKFNPDYPTTFTCMMFYDNTAASALTLNIASKGAKPIYINGAPSSASNYILPYGLYIVYYDGENFYFNTNGTIKTNVFNGKALNLNDPTDMMLSSSSVDLNHYSINLSDGAGDSISISTAFNSLISLQSFDGNGGHIKGVATPEEAKDAANKEYVDGAVEFKLSVSGGSMFGDIGMGGLYKVTGLADPIDEQDAVNKRTYSTLASYGDNLRSSGDVNMSYQIYTDNMKTWIVDADGPFPATINMTPDMEWLLCPNNTGYTSTGISIWYGSWTPDPSKTYRVTVTPESGALSTTACRMEINGTVVTEVVMNKLVYEGPLTNNIAITLVTEPSQIFLPMVKFEEVQNLSFTDGLLSGADKYKYDGYENKIEEANTKATSAESQAQDAVFKANLALPKTGGTISGALTLSGTLTTNNTVTLKRGVTFSPTSTTYKFNMNNHKIEGVSDPTANTDAANKKYVDDQFAKLGHSTLVWTRTDGTTFNEDVVVWNS